jgi:hypothetical protein
MNAWRVDRENEVNNSSNIFSIKAKKSIIFFKQGVHFKEHSSIANRKLLWHGTSVAVVAAILKTGLRIMPHSGGRVGRGIYFASENGKSAGKLNKQSFEFRLK